MRVGTLAAVLAGLDVLLGVVPGAARVGHEDGQGEAGDERTGEQAAEGVDVDEADDEGDDHGEGTGDDHLLQRRRRGDLHATSRVGDDAGLALTQARDLPELATDLFDHLLGGTTDGVDREGGEEERQHGAEEEADEDVDRTEVEREDDVLTLLDGGLIDGELEALEQRQSGESSGADSEALGHRSGGVAEGVEGVGDLADLGVELGHLGDAAGVVGDRTVGVDGHDHAGGGEHADRGHGDAVDAALQHGATALGGEIVGERHVAAPVGDADTDDDEDDGGGDRHHAGADATEHGGGRARLGLGGDLLDRPEVVGGVVLGGLAEGPADDEATDDGDGEADRVVDGLGVTEEPEGHADGGDDGDGHGDVGAQVQGRAQLVGVGRLAALHQEGAEDRGDHADEGDGHREDEEADDRRVRQGVGSEGEGEGHEGDRGDDRAGVRLEEVGAHAGDVADVVAHVVGDGGRVAGVVLGDAGLHLADEVGADVGGLGVDAAAHAAEQGDGRAAEAVGRDDLEGVIGLEDHDEQDVDDRETEEGQTGDREAHHGTAAEGDGEGLGRALLGSLGGAGVGHGRHGHAGVTGAGRQDRTEYVADGAERRDHGGDEDGHHHDEAGDPGVFLLEEGLGALLDLGHQEDHAVVAWARLLHVLEEEDGQRKAGDRRHKGQIGDSVHDYSSRWVDAHAPRTGGDPGW